MFALQRWNGKENKFNKVEKQKNNRIEKKNSKILGYMWQNVVHAKI